MEWPSFWDFLKSSFGSNPQTSNTSGSANVGSLMANPSNQQQNVGAMTSQQIASQGISNSGNSIDWASMNGDNWLEMLSQAASDGDDAAKQMLMNYFMSEQSQKTARDWQTEQYNTQYQRIVEDLKKAGISPYVLSAGSTGIGSPSGVNYTGSQYVSENNNKRTNQVSLSTKNASNIINFFGLILNAIGFAIKATASGSGE